MSDVKKHLIELIESLYKKDFSSAESTMSKILTPKSAKIVSEMYGSKDYSRKVDLEHFEENITLDEKSFKLNVTLEIEKVYRYDDNDRDAPSGYDLVGYGAIKELHHIDLIDVERDLSATLIVDGIVGRIDANSIYQALVADVKEILPDHYEEFYTSNKQVLNNTDNLKQLTKAILKVIDDVENSEA